VCLHSLRAKEAHTIHAIHTLTLAPPDSAGMPWLTRHAISIKSGHITRYPTPEPEKPAPEPVVPEV
jgi:hypothetical protein